MTEAMYEADEARQLEEDRIRVMANTGDSEEYKEESQRQTGDCPGTYDSASSDVRAAGDSPDSELPLAVEMDDGSRDEFPGGLTVSCPYRPAQSYTRRRERR